MKTFLRILSFSRPYSQFLPQYIIFTLLGVLFGLFNFLLLKPLLDVLFKQKTASEIAAMSIKPSLQLSFDYLRDLFNYYLVYYTDGVDTTKALLFICVVIVISVFLSNLFVYLSSMILAKVRAKVIRLLRMSIFQKVSALHLGYFTTKRKGDLISRITNDVQEIENSIVYSLKVIIKEPATLIAYFTALFVMSPKLTFFTLLVLPITGFFISEIIKRLKRTAVASQQSLGNLVSILDEALSGIRVIKAFNAKTYIDEKFDTEANRYANINVSLARKNELASPLSQFLGVTVVAGIVYYGGQIVLSPGSQLSPTQFFTYIAVFSQILPPAKSISNAFSSIQRGVASGDRIFSVTDIQPDIRDQPEARQIEQFDDKIRFENVSFAYEEHMILKNINLEIEKGKTIALVGPSGGGKSTLADLIPRFYDPTEGKVTIDGVSLKEYQKESVRALMGVVTQESILFNDTVFNNIAFGMEDVSEEEVIKAAKIANAHDFIQELEHGYQTPIGERGSKLSGGQRQRLSIARAVLKNPPILVLDEATSALDSESERLVQEALTKLMEHRTSVVIAHRLSTIQHADEIVVLQEGQIIERGTHKELLEQEGLYKKLNTMQAV